MLSINEETSSMEQNATPVHSDQQGTQLCSVLGYCLLPHKLSAILNMYVTHNLADTAVYITRQALILFEIYIQSL